MIDSVQLSFTKWGAYFKNCLIILYDNEHIFDHYFYGRLHMLNHIKYYAKSTLQHDHMQNLKYQAISQDALGCNNSNILFSPRNFERPQIFPRFTGFMYNGFNPTFTCLLASGHCSGNASRFVLHLGALRDYFAG